jgi:hypothetical protein
MKTWILALALALAAAPLGTLAQTNAPIPSYAHPAGETIKGTVRNFDGKYTMYVKDVHGYIDNISLRQGTIISPTGITLQTGFPVIITGHASGNTFVADEIVTPISIGYGYGYPYYPYPVAYAPYPYFSLGFFGYGRGGRHYRP